MKYYLFMDESGDHNLRATYDGFPVFTLCGILMSEESYKQLDIKFSTLKKELWGEKKIVFHSRDIRKCEKGFEVLFDLDKKKYFLDAINNVVKNLDYAIISATVEKERYAKKYVHKVDVYDIALEFIIERTVFFLDDQVKFKGINNVELHAILEKRGDKEDLSLTRRYNQIRDLGTDYVKPQRIKTYFKSLTFGCKNDHNHGIEFADLIAYPIARHVIDPKKVNLAFDILSPKIYQKNGKIYGMKVFP